MLPPWSIAPAPPDPLPDRVDVVVVGGSLAGLTAAVELAEAGTKVALIEARAAPGRGCTGRDPGLFTGGLPEHPWRLIHAIGPAKTQRLYALFAESRAIIEAHAPVAQPAMHLAIDQREIAEIERSAIALADLGLAVERLDGEGADARSGGAGFTAAMVVAGEGSLDGEALADAVARQARRLGVAIVSDTRVEGWEQVGDEHRVQTSRGGVRAEAVVLTAGTGLLTVDPRFVDKVVPVREHALRYDRVTGPVVAGRAQYGYAAWRADADGGLRVSGCRWATPHLEVGETEERPSQTVLAKVEAFARAHLPVDGASISHRWARILCATCDGLPIVGPMPGDPTVVCCTGFQGFGAALGPASGAGVAKGLLTGQSGLPPWWSPGRFL